MINNQTTAYACRNYYYFFFFADKITTYAIKLIYDGNIVKIIHGAIV